MKKFLVALSLAFVFLGLTACSQQETETAEKTYKANLAVVFTQDTTSQEVVFEEGDTVMDVLEEYHQVEETNGMVTAIDGVSQDPATNTYWMYTINGELAEKGAESQLVAEGDKIEFYLETFE